MWTGCQFDEVEDYVVWILVGKGVPKTQTASLTRLLTYSTDSDSMQNILWIILLPLAIQQLLMPEWFSCSAEHDVAVRLSYQGHSSAAEW